MSSLYRRGSIWWWKAYSPLLKKYLYQSLKTADRRAALLKKTDLDAEFYRQHATANGQHPVAQALLAYVEATSNRRSAHDQRNERTKAQILCQAFGDQGVATLTRAQVEDALEWLRRQRDWTATTYNSYRKTLRGMTKFAKTRGWLWLDPAAELPRLKETPYERVWIPYRRWGEFLKLGGRSVYGIMATAAMLTGLRPKELFALEWRDLDWERRQLTVRAEIAKNRRARYLPLPDRLIKRLKPLRQPSGLIFEGYSRGVFEDTVHRWLKRMGYSGKLLGPYVLRHSYLARMAELLPAFQVQQLAGHQDIKTTQRYTHAHEIAIPQQLVRSL